MITRIISSPTIYILNDFLTVIQACPVFAIFYLNNHVYFEIVLEQTQELVHHYLHVY